jgi:hypothetical protein
MRIIAEAPDRAAAEERVRAVQAVVDRTLGSSVSATAAAGKTP